MQKENKHKDDVFDTYTYALDNIRRYDNNTDYVTLCAGATYDGATITVNGITYNCKIEEVEYGYTGGLTYTALRVVLSNPSRVYPHTTCALTNLIHENTIIGAANPEIKKVIFNPPATIVKWSDGSKTVVKCQDGDTFSKETGLATAIVKKLYGNKGSYNNIIRKWCNEDAK